MKWVKVTLRLIVDDFPEPLILMVCEDLTANLEKGKPPKFRNSLQLEQLPSLGRQCVGETRGAALPTCSTCRRVSRLVATADIEHEEELPRHLSATKSAGGYKFVSMTEESLENPVLIAKQPKTTKSLIQLHEEFIGAVSHELRTPLTNMKMAIQMLGIALSKEKKFLGDADSSKMARYLEILNNECDREINLINNFLDLKRLETNSQPLVLETIHIEEWLWQVVGKFKQHHFQLCQQNLSLNISPSLPPLRCNSLNLERIFMELLTNACKFSPPDAAIIISAELKANQVFLQVTNSGVEIPSTELPRIFDKFYRIPSNDPAKQGGTGLGLALVQKLTKQLGGTITVESRSNRTCFTLVVDHQ
ncbi:MAG TPA: HAMP domain-containing histidine kinase [Trichormus sp. M33_DOE_039]|nr:HAMP domain-containing histidine kinase [Trichormus sp. M33_DOE_039]